MAKFIECTANDASSTKLMFNVDHIISIVPNSFESTTRLMMPGITFEVREPYLEVQQMLNPH